MKHLTCAMALTVALANAAGAADTGGGLEEIVVTAQKRTENLQDVPMSITALDAKVLERIGAVDFTDYAAHVPNLAFAYAHSGQLGSRQIALRGVYGAGTTGFYIDDTPVPESMDPLIADIDRIEVLRGPQGTLYGARSMGGTVKLITRQADATRNAAGLHTTVSNTEHGSFNYLADAWANLVLVDSDAAVRVSGYREFDSGVFTRVAGLQPALPADTPFTQFPPHHGVDDQGVSGGQILGMFRFLDGDLIIRPRVALQHLAIDGFALADDRPDNFTQVRLFDLNEPGWDDWQHYSLTINGHTGAGDIVSSTALFRRGFENWEDYSEEAVLLFGIPPTPALIHAINHTRRFVHETRFVSAFSGPVQFTGGIFYANTLDRRDFPADNTIAGLNDFFGGAFGTDVVFSQASRTVTREA
ncbi:MAG TPA: TonB-dependent receptor plug domain-containing protein, partial [Steroidobacteraceae bacterium]|nr:TonB-dependent receptor plug domain-containing protein [Steroidobacteraceae bacterium]